MLRPLLAQNSSVSLIFEDPVDIPALFTDEAKVSQILRNFISNALKFTEKGEIRVAAHLGHDNTVVVSVADTGIGIRREEQDRIFQEWTQVEGRLQKAAKGSGLGLPLSRKLANLLGGNTYVKSQPGVGSTFFVQIPMQFRGETEIDYVTEAKREIDPSKLPVLIVEDNREALFVYEKFLKGSVFQVIPARNLGEARQSIDEFRPIAVVLDVLLEGEQSWELLQELRNNPATNMVPVFVITVVDNQAKALAMGATDFHAKPVDRGWLLNKLESAAHQANVPRVLIVDDDEASRYVVRNVFANSGLSIVEAALGSEALRMVKISKPDIIILDLNMPDMSGFEVLDQLKDDPETAHIPVVIHTSRDLNKQDRELLAPAVAILAKQGQARELARVCFAQALAVAGIPLPPGRSMS